MISTLVTAYYGRANHIHPLLLRVTLAGTIVGHGGADLAAVSHLERVRNSR